jgi:peptidoglycan/LPS O-acetylase OafA/YrhL
MERWIARCSSAVLLLVWGVVLLVPTASTYGNNPSLYAPLAQYLTEPQAGALLLVVGLAGLYAALRGSTRFYRAILWAQVFCLFFASVMLLTGTPEALTTWAAVVQTVSAFVLAVGETISAGRRHEARKAAGG